MIFVALWDYNPHMTDRLRELPADLTDQLIKSPEADFIAAREEMLSAAVLAGQPDLSVDDLVQKSNIELTSMGLYVHPYLRIINVAGLKVLGLLNKPAPKRSHSVVSP